MNANEAAKEIVEIFRRCSSEIREIVEKSKIEGMVTYHFECNIENITIKVKDIACGVRDDE